MAAAGAGDEGDPDVLLPVGAGGVRSGLAMPPGDVVMGMEPTGGGAWLAAAGAGVDGEPDVLLPLASGAGLRSGLTLVLGAMASEPAGAADGLAAAGAGVEDEPEVFDCANATLALPATTRAVNAWVKKLETFMGTFEVAALGSV